jgi:hypothetical protein
MRQRVRPLEMQLLAVLGNMLVSTASEVMYTLGSSGCAR